jgi:DnaJ-domain-containing protein 1
VQAQAALSSCSQHSAASPLQQAARPLRPASSSRRGRRVVVQAAQDFYNILGVDRNADKKQIKQAYRQKARKFHPVSVPGGCRVMQCCLGWF